MSGISDTTAPATEFGLFLLRNSRMHVNKNLRFNLGRMTSSSIFQYEDGMNRSMLRSMGVTDEGMEVYRYTVDAEPIDLQVLK